MAKVSTTIRLLVSILAQLKYMAILALTRAGLFKSPEEADDYTDQQSANSNSFVLMSDGSSPSLVPVPVSAITATIKMRVPVVRCGDFLDKDGGEGEGEGEDGVSCAVCWDCVERSHGIRELSNCRHVFHRDCLDRWVDEGQVSCPLCRSMLLPANTNPWVVLRNAHLSSPQL